MAPNSGAIFLYPQEGFYNMKLLATIITALIICASPTAIAEEKTSVDTVSQFLQDVSVTVKTGGLGEGSGVIITREIQTKRGKEKINFIWTAAHVVDGLRSERRIVKAGQTRSVIEFKDAQIVKELVENGRRVGELKMDAKVIKYSDSENGEDLALLMIRKRDFISKGVEFYINKDKPVSIGTELYHVGSLLGQLGSNSQTRGIMSQVGRVLDLGTGDGVVFDQTSCPGFPGSSGGGIFLSEKAGPNSGKYVGMLVRGAGETFNLIVPVRRMKKYAEKENILWAIDETAKTPTLEEIISLPIEGGSAKTTEGTKKTEDSVKFPTLLNIKRGSTNVKRQ
tara:strand:- start:81632 stop:82645 length:1014 start_codon:yes stop_codon:yes gene_type:complete